MARIKIVGVKRVSKSITDRINRAIKDSNIYKDAHKVLEEEIRSGKNPKTGSSYRKLEQSTIENRKRIAKTNPTHPDYSPARSNLTLTGSLLDGLRSVFNKGRGVLEIKLVGKHPGYASQQGKKIKGSSKNRAEIAGHLKDQGRPILVISKKLTQRIVKAFRRL